MTQNAMPPKMLPSTIETVFFVLLLRGRWGSGAGASQRGVAAGAGGGL
jgi:hypothetical protein